jgi:phosphatidylglycerol:prolipoprotein diacylglycerol transferase
VRQILFNLPIFHVPIYGYGAMLVVAFIACVQLIKALARRSGFDPEIFVNAALIAMVSGIVGARLSHVLENFHEYTDPQRSVGENLLDAFNIRSGGLTYYGGFILATICCIAYGRKHRVPILKGMDIVAPVLMLGLAFGRIGCYLNGCCYGEISQSPLAVSFPYYSYPYIDQYERGFVHPPTTLLKMTDNNLVTLKTPRQAEDDNAGLVVSQEKSLPVLPAQLYSSFTSMLLMGLLLAFWTLPHQDGRVFALMLLLEGPSRFLLEMIRVEPAVYVHHFGSFEVSMSLSMILGLANFIAGVILWFAVGVGKAKERQPALTGSAVRA